jgi:hypothetical protein
MVAILLLRLAPQIPLVPLCDLLPPLSTLESIVQRLLGDLLRIIEEREYSIFGSHQLQDEASLHLRCYLKNAL